jgi:quinolinate synthase
VNTTADVKAELDVCCTSANAVKVVSKLSQKRIIFVPDKYLGQFVQSKTDKEMILWDGYCPTHLKILPENIIELKKKYPEAKVITHPECSVEVVKLSDEALSTAGMIKFVRETTAKTIIVATENGMIYRLQKEAPDKKFIPATSLAICPNMKRITLDKVVKSLETLSPEVKVPENIRVKALNAVNKMLEII